MAAGANIVEFSGRVRLARLLLVVFLTPLVTAFWLGGVQDGVIKYYGGNPDGPALVMLGAFVIVIGLAVPSFFMLFVGLPYALIMSGKGALTFSTIILPALPIGIVYGFLAYSQWFPDRYPTQARIMGLAALLGVFVASMCFYIVGVWRNTALGANNEKDGSPGTESVCDHVSQ